MTRRLLRRVPPLADCALTYHTPKSRVRWQVWSPPEQQWVWVYGTVSVMDGYFETSPLSDPRAGGSGDGAPPAPNPPSGAGGVFQTGRE